MSRLIDADALMRDIENYHLSDGMFQHWVEVQPTVDAEPVKRGRWIKMSDADGVFYGCSECGEWHKEMSNYCPNCGAKMGTLRDEKVRKGTNRCD